MEKNTPNPPKKQYHRLSVDVDQPVFQRLQMYAYNSGQSLRHLINQAISRHIASLEAAVKK
jgi:predicted HicB family RNase H-like nuclease